LKIVTKLGTKLKVDSCDTCLSHIIYGVKTLIKYKLISPLTMKYKRKGCIS